ncbi:MAG: CDGSH iron-sulfur domain-containing protein [Cyanobacteria bacterium P01_E01_bin.48]
MSEPVVAAKKPAVLTLEPGQYSWCACGQSDEQPFCNGAHRGTEFTPMRFEVEDEKQVSLCQCKATGNPPYCDGSHNKL